MLFYRLILLSWYAIIANGYVFQAHRPPDIPLTMVQQRGVNPQRQPNAFRKSIAPNQAMVPNQPMAPNQAIATNQAQLVPQAQQRVSQLEQHVPHQHLQQRHFSNRVQRPNHVSGASRSLMTQVVQSSLHHRGQKPRKFIDFLDNGAQWHHYISKPRRHHQELRINEGNYHVNLKYGNHDLQEQDDRRNRNPDMYVGETISGENSLSKFTAPPVYDEESASFQRKTKLDLNYEADTPEAAATEKQNTEQFVNRLHSLMTPLGALSPPYDFTKGRGKKESYKLIQNAKEGQMDMEHDDDDDSPPSEFQNDVPPMIEAKPDRKTRLPNTDYRLPNTLAERDGEIASRTATDKGEVRSGLERDGTMDIINKYGLSDEFKGDKGGYQSLRREEEMMERNGERKQQVEVRDDGDNSVKSYDGDNRDEEDESARWRSNLMENSKRMDVISEGREKDEIS